MPERKIRVLVVEDSMVFRSLLVKYLNQDPLMEVVAVANDPFEARDAIIQYNPDVMTLDVELPKMDGIEFLRKLMPQFPVRTVVISALSNRVFDALQVGAVDFVAKPVVSDRRQLEEFVRTELPEKIKIAARAKLKPSYGIRPGTGKREIAETRKATDIRNAADMRKEESFSRQENNSVRRNDILDVAAGLPQRELPKAEDIIVAIGASTGGTEATTAILEEFGPDIPGVVVTQHMPEGFTKMYAQRLNSRLRVRVKEAEQGDVILPGNVYIAPGGDQHMEIVNKGGQYRIALKTGEKVNGHRPSVEVLFDSVAREAGNRAVGVILTGMGGDGAKGLLHMRQAGARTIGQDESTCVVYGMPRVAFEMGAVESQNKLSEIAKKTYYFVEQIQKRDNG